MNERKFLDALKGKPCKVFIINGVRLEGKLFTDSKEAIFLKRDGVVSMTYKHATANVMPNEPLNIEDDNNYNY